MCSYPSNEVLEADNIHHGEENSGENVECPYFFLNSKNCFITLCHS